MDPVTGMEGVLSGLLKVPFHVHDGAGSEAQRYRGTPPEGGRFPSRGLTHSKTAGQQQEQRETDLVSRRAEPHLYIGPARAYTRVTVGARAHTRKQT